MRTGLRSCPAPDESGFVSLELALGLAVLVLPVALVVLVLPSWFARQNLARLAAQQAARTAVVNDSLADGSATAGRIATDAGPGAAGDLSLTFDPASSLARGGVVTALARVRMPAVVIPGLGDVGSFTWTARYSEPVDRYRSGP